MPVTPTQARRLYKEREELLEKVDEAILAAYSNGLPSRVEVGISEEQYKNETLVEWLKEQYLRAGWEVTFDLPHSDTEHILLILKEPQK